MFILHPDFGSTFTKVVLNKIIVSLKPVSPDLFLAFLSTSDYAELSQKSCNLIGKHMPRGSNAALRFATPLPDMRYEIDI